MQKVIRLQNVTLYCHFRLSYYCSRIYVLIATTRHFLVRTDGSLFRRQLSAVFLLCTVEFVSRVNETFDNNHSAYADMRFPGIYSVFRSPTSNFCTCASTSRIFDSSSRQDHMPRMRPIFSGTCATKDVLEWNIEIILIACFGVSAPDSPDPPPPLLGQNSHPPTITGFFSCFCFPGYRFLPFIFTTPHVSFNNSCFRSSYSSCYRGKGSNVSYSAGA
jgi:hypothetical protein